LPFLNGWQNYLRTIHQQLPQGEIVGEDLPEHVISNLSADQRNKIDEMKRSVRPARDPAASSS
jgi:hypothetical protein